MSTRPSCYLDLSIGGKPIGRVVIALYVDKAAKTCENFRHLCLGDMRSPKGVKLHYRGSIFHRVVRDFMMQGGDFTAGDGTGGLSIYGKTFEDENLEIPHDRAGLVSMANKGVNSNSSQFFITFKSCRALDGHHVVFGEVVEGWDLCVKIARVRTDDNNKPFESVRIDECGELPPPVASSPLHHKHHSHRHHHSHSHRKNRPRSRSRS